MTIIWTSRARAVLAMTLIVALAACTGTSSSGGPTPSTKEVRELRGPNDCGCLSSSAQFGNLVWTAGHLPEGVPATAPFADQVKQVLDNLEATLKASGAGFDTLLKVNIYLLNWDDWDTFNRIYLDRIGSKGLPPRSTVQVAYIGLDYRIEMEMVAYVRSSAP